MKKRKWLIAVGIFTLLLLILVACSQDKESKEEKDPEKPSTSSNVEETNSPEQGGTFTILEESDTDSLDVFRLSAKKTQDVAGLVYNRLVTYETGPDVAFTDYNIIPDLAERWDISDDGKVYTFHLRDASWHDISPVNGRAFVADDVVATMNNIINLPGHQAYLLSEVESVNALDEKTVEFTLKQPYAPFLNNMASHFMWILPKEAVENKYDYSKIAIGTGPFIMEEWQENIQINFVENKEYFEEGKPYLDNIIYKVVPDQGARIAAFRTGQGEYISGLSLEEIENIKKTNPEIIINNELQATHTMVALNMEREPFQNLGVRKAISMAIDRQGAVDRISGGGEISGLINPTLGDWGLSLEEREKLLPYDSEKAKQLLTDAGFPDGFTTNILVTTGYGEQTVRMAQWIAEDLRAIGITAEIELAEYATFISERYPKKDYDIIVTLQTYFQEPDDLHSQLTTKGSRNRYGVSDPKIEEMLNEQRLILDVDERKEMIHEIERYALENVVNPIPIATSYNLVPKQPYVKNYEPHASYGYFYLKDTWIDK